MEQNTLPVITQEKAIAQISIALTQQNISVQKIQNQINTLVFNEDNLQEIADMINILNKGDKIIKDKHKELKEPSLGIGRAYDDAKNSLLSINESLRVQLRVPYNKICADIDRRKASAALELQRVTNIQSGIENNVISFSLQIAQCETNEQLLSVERMINLEKSENHRAKYTEFHEEAISKYDTALLPILKLQKEKIKQKEALKKQIEKAESNNDPVKLDELREKESEIENEILQNQINVQQKAISQSSTFFVPLTKEVLPEINTVNRIKFEITDLNVAVKKCPELLEVKIKHSETQKVAMALKDAGMFKDKSEVIVNGIKFFIDKTYKS